MREILIIGWEYEECDGNPDAENQCGNADNLGGNAKDVENPDGNEGNQGGNLSMVASLT